MAEEPLLLEGLRVLDVASFIAAPVAATVLADFGAEVIKVEPLAGDSYRDLINAPGYGGAPFDYHWFVDNRHKQSLAIDLKAEAGWAILAKLVASADVFVTNYPSDVRSRLKLTYEDIGPLNPRLIYASLTAYGESGPERARPGFDSTAWWARTGMMDLLRPDPDGAPARSLPGMGDHATGMSLAAAIMMGLYRRERTGKGGHVSTSLMSNGLWSNAFYAQAALAGVEVQKRPTQDQAPNAMANHYRCSDGRWFILALLNEDLQWPVLVRAIGRPDLTDDPRFATTTIRRQNGPALVAILNEVFAQRDWPYWKTVFQENRLTFGNVSIMEDLRDDEQMRESGALVPVAGDNAPCELTIDSPVRLDGERKRPPVGAPALGADTRAVLQGAGYSADEIETLIATGVVRT